MTVFAGIINLNGKPVDSQKCDTLLSIFEKYCGEEATFHSQSSSNILLSFDIKAYSKQYIECGKKNTLIIAGDPIIRHKSNNIGADITCLLQAGMSNALFPMLQKSRGVFSGVFTDQNAQKMQIFTDKLGVRPVYYYQKDNLFIFSSLLSVIESLPFVDLSIDYKNISENIAFTYNLSNRTPYKLIHRLNGGECLTYEKNKILSNSYWCWNNISIIENITKNNIRDLYVTFEDAIKLRLDGNDNAFSFISGGLDSRVVNSLVNKHVNNIYAFNFSIKNSQDKEYARKYAEAANLNYTETTVPSLSFPNWSQLISDVIAQKKDELSGDFNNKLVWSGDGGSVGTGAVYMNEAIDDALSDGNVINAVNIYMSTNHISIPKRFIKNGRKNLLNIIKENTLKEFISNDRDPSKSIYYFLMNNDQKRHLSQHYETICQHGIEFLLPFFDSDFLAKIYAFPTKEILYHKLYMKWFDNFPDNTRSVPWQTYPQHVACPIKVNENYSYQWGGTNKEYNRFKDFINFLSFRKEKAVQKYFCEYRVFVAMLLHLFHIKDFSYLLKKIQKVASIRDNECSNSKK